MLNDPVEKKPLAHFMSGTRTYSISTVGCNLSCLHCQNWGISQVGVEEYPYEEKTAEEVLIDAVSSECSSISYTYTEPTIFFEFMRDVAKIANERGIKNIFVSNGYINEKPLIELCKYVDAANIDIKGDDRFYSEVCGGISREPVLRSLKVLKQENIHIEITYLIIPTYNDDLKDFEEICKWIKKELGE